MVSTVSKFFFIVIFLADLFQSADKHELGRKISCLIFLCYFQRSGYACKPSEHIVYLLTSQTINISHAVWRSRSNSHMNKSKHRSSLSGRKLMTQRLTSNDLHDSLQGLRAWRYEHAGFAYFGVKFEAAL